MNQLNSPPPIKNLFLGIIILVVGVGIFIWFLVSSIGGVSSNLIRVVIPAEKEIRLTEPGEYTIFHEYRSFIDGKIFSTSNFSGFHCSLVSSDDKPVTLNIKSSRTRYTSGGRSGIGIYDFKIDQPGTYFLTAKLNSQNQDIRAVLAIGHGFTGGILKTIFIGLVIMFVSLGGGIYLIVSTISKRKKARSSQ